MNETENQPDPNEADEHQDITSPPDETHEATTPPGGGDTDDEALQESEDQLDQAGGGH
jgi:hypothetical protein